MKIKCVTCGALVEEGSVICGNCGRVLAPRQQAQPMQTRPIQSVRQTNQMQYERRYQNYGNYSVPPAYSHRQPPPEPRSRKGGRSRLAPVIGWLIALTVVAVLVVIAYAAVRVYLVKRSGYDFGLNDKIKLPSSTYSEAFDRYFTDGKWDFSFKKNAVTFKGKDDRGREFKLVFGRRGGQTVVTELTINGKAPTTDVNDIMANYVMGMFMA
ncbi:MAG: zinc ribbon domain-containing protein [Ruminococcus sp.]|nr:zinc ribbon domain-containing protein [Ruminococcus sp.]